jgi:hypothetical protein
MKKVYVVESIIYGEGEVLEGIFDDFFLAKDFMKEIDFDSENNFDEVRLRVVALNIPLEFENGQVMFKKVPVNNLK